MCGIAGIISSAPTKSPLGKMLQIQQHRGPDNTDVFIDEGFAGLGHNRLSIIDLSSAANQPFQDASGRYILVFNGEIYNYKELKTELNSTYRFMTTSDTEVLLAAFLRWGADCLSRLKGMFSFAIWDNQEKKMFAARDRFGVKPFYYSEGNEDFCFASEIKSLQVVSGNQGPDEKTWANYFVYGSYGRPHETFFNGVQQLPAGHFMMLEKNSLKIKKWYDFPKSIKSIPQLKSIEEIKAHYLELLKTSVKLRFRADVPVGFNISGGLDSSLLLALVNLKNDTQKVKAYTFYTGNKNYDELPWVQKMISNTKNPLTKVILNAKDVAGFSNIINKTQNQPYGGIPTLAYAKIFQQARKDGVKVLLDGQGMDEQWAGYDYYSKKTNHTIQGQAGNPFREKVLQPEFLKLAKKPAYPKPFKNELQNTQYRDLFYTKIPRALRFNDGISMAFSTELREPFLDHDLVEFAFAQPDQFKINNGVHKYLLRELVKDLVPPEITFTPKRPLQTPQREWLGSELIGFVEENLAYLKNSNYAFWFNFSEIQNEWKNYISGNRESSFHIWQWIMAANFLNRRWFQK